MQIDSEIYSDVQGVRTLPAKEKKLSFDQVMRRLVQVPKKELDAELAKHDRMRMGVKAKKQTKCRSK